MQNKKCTRSKTWQHFNGGKINVCWELRTSSNLRFKVQFTWLGNFPVWDSILSSKLFFFLFFLFSTYVPDKCCMSTVCQSLSRLLRPYSEAGEVTWPITGLPLPAGVTWLTRVQSRVSNIAYVSSSRGMAAVSKMSLSEYRELTLPSLDNE